MNPTKLYNTNLTLATDLYQISMAHVYFESGMTRHEAVFNLYFRKLPFGGKYAIAGGLNHALDLVENFRFTQDDIAFLMTLKGNDGRSLFSVDFLNYLRTLDTQDVTVHGIPEGSAVFPNEPLLRVQGPLPVVQMLETVLLTVVNYQTLVATKAARVKAAAKEKLVLEFGLRRAQGIDGGLAASRAAYLGGCDATSNVLAGQLYGIPVKGTHAHSMVMAFGDQKAAFRAYADACPNNVTLLVDTYDTQEGVRDAIEVIREAEGPLSTGVGYGIRLDSGDLAALSKDARRVLNQAGLEGVKIVASSDLDEYEIENLEAAGAPIDIYGVGTNLVTAKDQPALGGVYKLSAIRAPNGQWEDRIKVSEVAAKTTIPGIIQTYRFRDESGKPVFDVIGYDDGFPTRYATVLGVETEIPRQLKGEALGRAAFRDGRRLRMGDEVLSKSRDRAITSAHAFADGVPVFLEWGLYRRRAEMLRSEKVVQRVA